MIRHRRGRADGDTVTRTRVGWWRSDVNFATFKSSVMNMMNATRLWAFCSTSSRPLASRLATQQLQTRLFATAARPNYSQYFTRTSQSTLPTSSNATRSLFTQPSLFLRHALSFRGSQAFESRIGWYKDRIHTSAAPKRSTGSRRPRQDFQHRGPFERFRRWFDTIPPEVIVWSIIGLNGIVFAAWQVAKVQYVGPLIPFS